MLTLVAAVLLASPFVAFEGHWRCEGHFVRSGKAIASKLIIAADPASGVFVAHHDDAAPLPYHSVELWTADPDGQALHAAIADGYSGLRVFRSPPLHDDVLTFGRREEGGAQEQFRYELTAAGELHVDWSSARPGGPLVPGDTLTCRRTSAA